MLQYDTTLCLFTIGIICFVSALAAPTPPIHITTKIINDTTAAPNNSHFITIERLESLLRRAGEIFRPFIQNQMHEQQESIQIAPIPFEQLQPPTVNPYNFYLPPFDNDAEPENQSLDQRSRSLQILSPPPLNDEKDETNFYASKPKKLPKKFNAADKLVNIKWLNSFEREALADANGQIPKAVYLVNDERNRINFDDSFFAVEMQDRTPTDGNAHKENKSMTLGNKNGEKDSFMESEDDREDLIAAPAVLSYGLRAQKKRHFRLP